MRAIKRLFVIIFLLPAGYIAFVLSPFLEIIEEEKIKISVIFLKKLYKTIDKCTALIYNIIIRLGKEQP